MIASLLCAAVVCAAAMTVLGMVVARRPPGALDVAGYALRGRGVAIAKAFTLLGYSPPLFVLSAVAITVAVVVHGGRPAIATLLVTQALSQSATTVVKLGFRRPRQTTWVGIHEPDMSFPSGHTATAVVFFAGFAILALHAPLAPWADAAIAVLLFICAVAIPWSRLALGAHYVTDIAGGALFGAAWLCAAFAAIAALYGNAHRAL